MKPARNRILTINGSTPSIKFAMYAAADIAGYVCQNRGNALGRPSSLQPEFFAQRHTSFSKNKRYRTADKVDRESMMKRAAEIGTTFPGMDDVQLRTVSEMTGLHLFRKPGWIVA